MGVGLAGDRAGCCRVATDKLGVRDRHGRIASARRFGAVLCQHAPTATLGDAMGHRGPGDRWPEACQLLACSACRIYDERAGMTGHIRRRVPDDQSDV